MPYKLKADQENFKVVDGPFANKSYRRGEVYDDVPPEEKHRFESVRPAPKPARSSAKGADTRSGVDGPAAPEKTE